MTIKRNNRAFTLIEIIVMVGILALLATLLITKTEGIFEGSQQTIAKIFVRDSLKTALERYRMDLGSYPSTAEGLGVLTAAPANASGNWRGPYADIPGGKAPVDPFGEPYQYRYPGTRNKSGYDLFSKGKDKTEGTEDDIGNW
ncbi:MAG TPA: type II secretion system major pseudopilin GspG [Lacunisphaera sp.]|nr:type II secretion system major pseudopilin GspG [Lacunisphaera sp.]